MRIIFALLLLLSSAASVADEPDNLFVTFSKCAGVIESEVSDTNQASMEPGVLSNIVSNLKKAALLEDESKSLGEYYKFKNEGVAWYQEVRGNEDQKAFLMYVCGNAGQDAMDLVEIRGR